MLADAASHPLSWAPAFPMAPAGGLFVAIIGVGIVLGALFPNNRDFLLICAFVVATAALLIFWGTPYGSVWEPDRTSTLVFIRLNCTRNRSVSVWLGEVPKGR